MSLSVVFVLFRRGGVRDIFKNVADGAIQNLTEGVQGLGGDGLPVLHAVDRVGVHPLLIDQIVFRHTLAKQCLIKWPIADQCSHPCLR